MKLFYTFLTLIGVSQLATSQLQSFEPTADFSGKEFGTEVAMTSNDILVSSISSSSSPGKVYLFNTNLEQVQSFYPADALMDDRFGSTFSINNNFIAIGAPYHDSVSENTGAIYLYKKNGTTYDFLQKITANDAMPGDNFGSSTKMQNGFLLIAARGDEPDTETNTNRGSVYVYTFNGSEWTLLQKLSTIEPIMESVNIIPSLGGNFFINNDQMKIWSNDYYTSFAFIDGLWVYQSASQTSYIVGGGSYAIFSEEISDSQLFSMASGDIFYGINIQDLTPANNSQFIDLQEQLGEIQYYYQDFAVNNGHLFVGNAYTGLPIKSPVMYYKKIGNQWQFQRLLYGNGPEGIDDTFGIVLSTAAGMAVFGAPKEGTGKAYFASEAALKTESFNKNTMEVFPNPVQDVLKIKNDTGDISNVEVYSINGKLLLSIGNNPKEINLENFDAGMYFVKITTTDGIKESFKIIKN